MDQHLGIRIRAEHHAGGLQACAQRRSIFDDAVVNDRESLRRVAMRVGIAIAWFAMGGPTCVRDAGSALESSRQLALQVTYPSLAFVHTERAVMAHRYAC